jgi:hypothetical protein
MKITPANAGNDTSKEKENPGPSIKSVRRKNSPQAKKYRRKQSERNISKLNMWFSDVVVLCVFIFLISAFITGMLSAISHELAPTDRRSEDVGILSVIVTELKLSDIQMQIFSVCQVCDNRQGERGQEVANTFTPPL